MLNVPIKRLYPDSKVPTQGFAGDACWDLYVHSIDGPSVPTKADEYISSMYTVIHSGIAMAIPEDHVGLVFMRSSVCNTPYTFRNAVAVIDAKYRGEIIAKLDLSGSTAAMVLGMSAVGSTLDAASELVVNNQLAKIKDLVDERGKALSGLYEQYYYKVGERFGQILIIPRPQIQWVVLEAGDELPETDRGAGFGSSGK